MTKNVATAAVTDPQRPSTPSVKFVPLVVARATRNRNGILNQPRFISFPTKGMYML